MEINTTRDIARQILRHRSFSFQEFSQRYQTVEALGRLETMSSDEQTWEATDTPYLFSSALSPGDSKLALRTFAAEDTALWGDRDVFVQAYALVGGVPKIGGGTTSTSGLENPHDAAQFDPTGLFK
jgi:hypothetical protein